MPTKQISAHAYKALLRGNSSCIKARAETDKDAKFPKGKPADPTVNMTDEQKAEWEKQNKEHRDKFKSAASPESDTEAKFEKGEDVPLKDMPKELQDNAKNPPPAVQELKDKMKGQKKATRQRMTWRPEFRTQHLTKEAAKAGGLYGYTKKVQADCEASTRKLTRRAASLARAAWNKDERVASFLQTHAKRGKSRSAAILVSAMQDIGPKMASDREARVKSKRDSMRMMRDMEKKHGVSTKAYYQSVLDEVQAGVIAPSAVVGGGYKDGKKVAIEWLKKQMKSAKSASGSSNAAYLDSLRMKNKILKAVADHYGGSIRESEVELKDPDAEALYEYLAFDNSLAMQVHREFSKRRLASDKEATTTYGMYGAPSKVARLGLSACASLKEAAGEIAADLHRRRASRHASYTGFLGEHSKSAKCGYSRMLLGYYPDSSAKFASIAPKGVDEWLAWDED